MSIRIIRSALALAAAVCLSSSPALAQWRWLQPRPTGADLRDVTFSNASTVFAVGAQSTVLRSVDAGNTWEQRPTPIGGDLLAVTASGSTVVAVGKRGTILRSVDNGNTFAKVTPPDATLEFHDVQLLSGTAGVAVARDGSFFTTTNGFQTLVAGARVSFGVPMALWFDSPQRGWVVGLANGAGAGFIARTLDGGRTFQKVHDGVGGGLQAITGLSFFGQVIVVAAGSGSPRAVYSDDGGVGTWQDAELPGGGVTSLSLQPAPDDKGEFWLVADDGLWGIRTEDERIQRPLLQTRPRIWAVASAAAGSSIAVGEGGTIVRAVYDQGAAVVLGGNRKEKFTGASFATADGLSGTFTDNQATPRVWRTTNGGNTLSPGTIAPAPVVDVSLVDAVNGYGVLEDGRSYATADAFATGTARAHLTFLPKAIAFATAQQGYAAGDGIFRTPDGGFTWKSALDFATSNRVTDVAVQGLQFAAAVTDAGKVFVRVPGNFEGTWTPVQSDPTAPLRSVAIASNGLIVAGGAIPAQGTGRLVLVSANGSTATADVPRPVISVATGGTRLFALLDDGTLLEVSANATILSRYASRSKLLALASRTVTTSGGMVAAPFAMGDFGSLLVFDDNSTPPPPNLPPTLTAGPNPAMLPPFGTLQLTATGVDPEGQPVTYSWSVAASVPLKLDAPTGQRVNIAWTAPPPPGTVARVQVRACDPQNACVTGFIDVIAGGPPMNRPPVASAIGVSTPTNSRVLLDGSGSSDPDGDPLIFAWKQLSGTFAVLGPLDRPSLVLQSPASAGTLAFELNVCDRGGLCSRVEVLVIVVATNTNSPPVAQTTGDLEVVSGTTVLLDASLSIDPEDGRVSAFVWSQLGGPARPLTNATGAIAQFTAGAAGEVYRFKVRVCDSQNACSEAGINVRVRGGGPPNRPPVISVSDQTTKVGETVFLTARVSDPDNEPVKVAWAEVPPGLGIVLLQVGPVDASFTVPASAAGKVLQFNAKACDPRGACVSAVVNVRVEGVAPPPIVAAAGDDQRAAEGATIILDGSRSSGPLLSHRWTQRSGPTAVLTDLGAFRVQFITPRGPATLVFQLEVFDRSGRSATDEVSVFVSGPVGPVAEAGRDVTVGFGARVQLDGRLSSDPLGRPLTYSWKGPANVTLAGADSPTPIFFAPSSDAVFAFTLTVCAAADLCGTDTVSVTVRSSANLPPFVDAGVDRSVEAGTVIALDGTRSLDPEGQPLTASWRLVSGPAARIAHADALWTPVQIPEIEAEADLVLELEVCDAARICGVDRVSLRVLPRGPGAPFIRLTLVGATDDSRIDEEAEFEIAIRASCPESPCRDGGQVRLLSGPPLARIGTTGQHYRAPRVSRSLAFEFEGTLCDTRGRCSVTTVGGVIVDVINEPPVAVVGDSQRARARQRVILDAGRSYDPNREELTYSWKQSSGPVELELSSSDVARPRFTVPAEGALGTYTFTVEVCDARGACAKAEVEVIVEPGAPANRAPTAESGEDRVAPIGFEIFLDGGRSFDPDGDRLELRFTARAAMDGVSLTELSEGKGWSIYADVLPAAPVELLLQVCDPQGACDSESFTITFYDPGTGDPDGLGGFAEPVQACGCNGADPSALGLLALLGLGLLPRLRRRR